MKKHWHAYEIDGSVVIKLITEHTNGTIEKEFVCRMFAADTLARAQRMCRILNESETTGTWKGIDDLDD